ncbi:MAG: DUF4258 domain-containing protein [Candidatus Thiosymbion ectosymbiont of Robbea hypermnestra]|nr:DUF4258 domain-containing protein [Candidatus Thiosymbion ectosymbiont of Robbea hypermnestra]
MSDILATLRHLVASGDIRISEHGYEELANDGLTAREIVNGINNAILVEDYPNYPKGASVLVLQAGTNGQPVHVVWGIPKGHTRPAVLVTAYRPDPFRWNADFKKRKQ